MMNEHVLAFIEAAEQMIGTPFRHQGKLPGAGLDCLGLIWCAARQAGYDMPAEFPDERGYSKVLNHGRFMRAVERRMALKPAAIPAPGDVPVFWRNRRGKAQHCGIVDLSGEFFIHCSDELGVARSRLAGRWSDRIVSVFELPPWPR